KVGQHKTKKEAVTVALKEYIAHRKQMDIIRLFGSIHFAEDSDYKSARHR
ncbi:MAG: type II toxin-antitoxin system VapB family antitoxin, partial [Smithella sp.]